jgi:tRNA U38,U39,U40 pseudouridine synthase TruA
LYSCPLIGVYGICNCWMRLIPSVPFSKAINLHYYSDISVWLNAKTFPLFIPPFKTVACIYRYNIEKTESMTKEPFDELRMRFSKLPLCERITTQESLNGFSWNLILRKSTKTCHHVPNRTALKFTWKPLGELDDYIECKKSLSSGICCVIR